MALPLLALLLGGTWWLLLHMYPPRTRQLSLDASESDVQLSRTSYIVLALTVLTAFLWLTGSVHGLATGTEALVPVVVLFGARILDRQDFQSLPWDVLILAGGGLSLGSAVEASGLGEAVVEAIPAGALGPLGLTAALALVAATMTTFMSNTATANLLVPVAAGMGGSVGTSPLLVVVAYACSCTMILPVSTPPNAMVFSSGQITTADLVRPALMLGVVALGLTVLLAPHWWAWLGLR